MQLELIDFYELRTHKEIITELLRQKPSINLPIPVKKLAEAFGIHDLLERPLDGMQGALVANPEKSKGVILVDSKIANTQRQRFTIAHELGHFLLPGHGNQMSCSRGDMSFNSQARLELEANEFASELLMPTTLFRSLKEFRAEPDIQNILDLSRLFDVSLLACGFKYTKLNDYPVAVLSSCKKRVMSTWVNQKEIPFWLEVRNNDFVPSTSITSSSSYSKLGKTHSELVDSTIWFKKSDEYEMPRHVVEQVLIQDKDYRYTLLWFDEEICEAE